MSARVQSRSTLNSALLVVAGTLGTLPIALYGSAAIARFLPVSADGRYALGFALAIPIWISAMCVTLLARSGARALARCLLVAIGLAVLVHVIPY